MDSEGETLDTCGIAELAAAVQNLSNSVLRGNLTGSPTLMSWS
ncbi:hypothetical protein ACIRRA_17940 [Nocardia sp. NPDC101769]